MPLKGLALSAPTITKAALLTICVLSSTTVQAQGWKTFKVIGDCTINRYDRSEAAGPHSSCSATKFIGPVQALRVERVSEGHLIGFNGLSRTNAGHTMTIYVWFDGNKTQSSKLEATFVRDAAYPLDDCASFVRHIDEKSTLTQLLAGKQSLHIELPHQSDPTKQHGLTFPLKDAEQALQALDDCYRQSKAK